jgi:hypothetical protein
VFHEAIEKSKHWVLGEVRAKSQKQTKLMQDPGLKQFYKVMLQIEFFLNRFEARLRLTTDVLDIPLEQVTDFTTYRQAETQVKFIQAFLRRLMIFIDFLKNPIKKQVDLFVVGSKPGVKAIGDDEKQMIELLNLRAIHLFKQLQGGEGEGEQFEMGSKMRKLMERDHVWAFRKVNKEKFSVNVSASEECALRLSNRRKEKE